MVVAPENLQDTTLALIHEQAERARSGQPSGIFAKLNALVDYRVIEALYQASQAGVPIDMVVRGVCCLRPGLPGISETIRVTSIVDRFLEHSRLLVFGAEGEARVFLSSADWMPRNFHRRVEVMFPVESPDLKQRILKEIVPMYLHDNLRARRLRPDGSYERLHPASGELGHRSQEELLALRPGVGLPEAVSPGGRAAPAGTPVPAESPVAAGGNGNGAADAAAGSGYPMPAAVDD
jgi:polyphosphate kinase